MNIAFFINDISAIGGTERVTTQLANGLVKSGHNIVIVSISLGAVTPYFSVSPEIKLINLFTNPLSFSGSLLKCPLKLRKVLIEHSVNIVIGSDSQTGATLSMATIGLPVKSIIWEHFNASQETFLGSRWFARRIAALCLDQIIVLTKQDKALWQRKYHCRARVTDISNPCAFEPINNTPSADKTAKIVLAAGRYTEQKGFDLLIKAWAQLCPETRDGWLLKIVGPNGSDKPRARNLVDTYRLDNSVKLCDTAEDIQREYAQASVFVSSSRYEGFGLTIIEAMSQGLPVIAFDCPMGPGEILQSDYGILVPREDVNALAQALTRMMKNIDTRNYFSEQSLIRAQEFREVNIIGRWQTVLKELMAA